MLRLRTVERTLDALWPEFIERDGAVLLAHVTAPHPPATFSTLTEYERFYGHTHVDDLARWDPPRIYDVELDLERPDPASPEHARAWTFMQRVAELWLAKLRQDFPRYRFRVYATKLDDPILHFHRVREGEPVWISDEEAAEQVARGELRILDSVAN